MTPGPAREPGAAFFGDHMQAKREAARRGARKVSLRVLAPNETARRLYASCGFVVEGVLHDEFMLEGRFVDDVLMAHHLG